MAPRARAREPLRPLETVITLVLEHVDPELAEAHRELYPERIPEQIPLSLTLLYPWIPAESVTDADIGELHAFFAGRPALEFDLVRVAEFPGVVAYAVPEPDEALRATMRALWAKYPEYPPYRKPGNDPAPHCTLGRLEGPSPITLEQARDRVEPLLPVRCVVGEATLMEEYEPDRMRIREAFPFGG
jgi:2'-5' RNA ligase superfamily